MKKFKIFENLENWNNFHYLKSKNPKNPQLIYERTPNENVLDKLLFDLPENCRVLDLGCGDGVDSIYFYEKGCNVSALDFSNLIINENINKEPNIDWQVYDINDCNLPFNNSEFDLIHCRLSLHYFDRFTITQILSDIYNKLKSNGVLYFTVKNQNFNEKIKTGKKYLHKKEWLKVLNYYFDNINVIEHQGKLYNIPSKWLEFECVK